MLPYAILAIVYRSFFRFAELSCCYSSFSLMHACMHAYENVNIVWMWILLYYDERGLKGESKYFFGGKWKDMQKATLFSHIRVIYFGAGGWMVVAVAPFSFTSPYIFFYSHIPVLSSIAMLAM